MQIKSLIIILICIIVSPVWAGFSCQMTHLLGHEKLANNTKFWEDLAKIKNSDSELTQLINKYAPELLDQKKTVARSVASVRKEFKVSKTAEKSLDKIKSTNIYKHYEEFLDIITDSEKGVKAFYENPGRWHYEKLKENKNHHTVRLNEGYRVLFEMKDNQLSILEVSKSVTH